jgi:hypothetical protein
MTKKNILAFSIASSLFVFPLIASASTLTVSCNGTPTATNITWTGTASGGIAPVNLLWGNAATATPLTITEVPGTYSMTLQATDASSTVATTTCSAIVASPASSGPSITDQITALMNQIMALKSQITQLLFQQATGGSGTATSTPTDCFSFNRDLKQGDQGDDVKDLQITLSSDPSLFPSNFVTGFFGHMTQDGVKKFQEKHGIHSTGFFGPMSRTFFEDQCSTGDSNHNGVPDSIDEEGNQNQSDNGNNSATSTFTSDHEGGHQHGSDNNSQGN